MRFLLVGALLLIPGSAASAPAPPHAPGPAQDPTVESANPLNCPRTTRHYAGKGSMYRGEPIEPQKLTELPPAETYAAVVRHIGGCEVPLMHRDVRALRGRRQ